MKTKMLTIVILITFLGWFACANSVAQQLSLLKGSWVLDNGTVVQKENGKSFDMELGAAKKDLNLGIWDELSFNDGNLTAKASDLVLSGAVTVGRDIIEYVGAPALLTYTWKIEQDKLYIARNYADLSPDKPDILYNVSLVYIKKN